MRIKILIKTRIKTKVDSNNKWKTYDITDGKKQCAGIQQSEGD